MKTTLLTALLFLLAFPIREGVAQPVFQSFGSVIERGASVGAGIQLNGDRTLINGSVGFVTRSKFEFGVLVTRFTVDNQDEARTGIGLYFTSNPVKQTEEVPIGITVSSSYLYHIFSGGDFDRLADLGVDTNGGQTYLSAGVNHAFAATPALVIVPELEVGYVNTKTNFSGGGDTGSVDFENFFMGLAARVIVSNEGRPISVMPRLRFVDGETIGGISLTVGIPAPTR